MEPILFLILVAVAGLLRWLATKSGEETKQDRSSTPPPRTPTGAPRTQARPARTTTPEEERIRKFLEALGVPTDMPAPPPVTPRQPELPQRPLMPVAPPREMVSGGNVFDRRKQDPESRRKIYTPQPAQPEILPSASPSRSAETAEIQPPPAPATGIPMESPAFDAGEVTVVPPAPAPAGRERRRKRRVLDEAVFEMETAPTSSYIDDLSSPEALRRAIVLREIFGPPRSLQKVGALSDFV